MINMTLGSNRVNTRTKRHIGKRRGTMEDKTKLQHDWVSATSPVLFEILMPVKDTEKTRLVGRTPDEAAARFAFDTAQKVLTYVKPRPEATLELYFGGVVLDVFVQTREGDEFEPESQDAS